jgi:plasmid stabilization system protein ParE
MSALNDLDAIADYIALDNPAAAAAQSPRSKKAAP